ncbi:hypothetical protein BASA82_000355 [Batrachochytrium salamandrivorans]|nr:hypothetical protein BASA81_007299 [Batrachochytrium salamandrivorans]KAH9258853.1 hypothetical protein BASA81_002917 [Batrachochytrium salamandrivorans]KAH9262607.1 hypothetical protein BASA82_000355 [Batrachochytrium salamandrivorans]
MKRILVQVLPVVAAAGLGVLSVLFLMNRGAPPVYNPFPFNLVLTDECAKTFLADYNFLDTACLKLTLTKAVGYAIVLLSAVLKLPMIINVLKARSTIGLNTPSVALECVSQSLAVSAALKKQTPFGLWGESVIIFVQNVVLIALASKFASTEATGRKDLMLAVGVMMFTLVVLFAVPTNLADVLQASATLISMSSRVPQMHENYTQKHTGVLSLFTQVLQFVGSAVRMGTVFAGTKDFGTRLGSTVATALSFCVLFQVLLYWNESQKRLVQKQD